MTPDTNQTVLTDEEIHTIARNMPDGAGGMLIKWGYQQFAHALESAVLEKLRALGAGMGNPTAADNGHEATANRPETRASIGSEAATNLMSPNPGDVALPPMKGLDPNHGIGRAMQDYARAAVLADRQQRASPQQPKILRYDQHTDEARALYCDGWNACVEYAHQLNPVLASQKEKNDA